MRICSFEGARRIGKPRDWDNDLDGDCLDIFVLDSVDVLTGLPVMFTFYEFSEDEIEALKATGKLRLGIVGQLQHPVFNLAVLGPEIANTVHFEPQGEMGGVIRNAD